MTFGIDSSAYIHPTAVIDEPVAIGADTKIWHFTHVMQNASVGDRCSLGQGCFVGRRVRIGDRVRVQNHVSLFEGVIVEDDVFLGPSMVFTNVLRPRALLSQHGSFLTTHVRCGATVGANATIEPGVELGAWCLVAAGAVVTRDVEPYACVMGVPARRVGWVSRAGEPLDFDEDGQAQCRVTRIRYRLSAGGVEHLGR